MILSRDVMRSWQFWWKINSYYFVPESTKCVCAWVVTKSHIVGVKCFLILYILLLRCLLLFLSLLVFAMFPIYINKTNNNYVYCSPRLINRCCTFNKETTTFSWRTAPYFSTFRHREPNRFTTNKFLTVIHIDDEMYIILEYSESISVLYICELKKKNKKNQHSIVVSFGFCFPRLNNQKPRSAFRHK